MNIVTLSCRMAFIPSKLQAPKMLLLWGRASLWWRRSLAWATSDFLSYGRDVDFETVWGLGHTMAERTGESTENFIQWVNECLQG
jgi:hypothetical protein